MKFGHPLVIGLGMLAALIGTALVASIFRVEPGSPRAVDTPRLNPRSLVSVWSASRSELAKDKPVRPAPEPIKPDMEEHLTKLLAWIHKESDEPKAERARKALLVFAAKPGGPEVLERYLSTGEDQVLGERVGQTLRLAMLDALFRNWGPAAARAHDYVLEHPLNPAELHYAADGLSTQGEDADGYVTARLLEYTEAYAVENFSGEINPENLDQALEALQEVVILLMRIGSRENLAPKLPELELLLADAPPSVYSIYFAQIHAYPSDLQEEVVRRLSPQHPLMSHYARVGNPAQLDMGRPAVRDFVLQNLGGKDNALRAEFLAHEHLIYFSEGNLYSPHVISGETRTRDFRDPDQRERFLQRLEGLGRVLQELSTKELNPQERMDLAQRQSELTRALAEAPGWPVLDQAAE